ncbi:MAG: hypothetical protein LUC26_03860 [Prevotella sp.]|nr:hypothetical protein [Prevotella sp.]
MEQENTLNNIPKTNPFTVPDGYFDRLKGDILARTTQSEEPKTVVVSLHHRLLRPLIGIAATLCLALFGATIYTHSLGAGASLGTGNNGADGTEMLFASDNAEDYIMLDNDDIYRYLADMDW